ncbi:MAG: hypothetical protein CMC29_03965 [Flavobacteriaceae bacterium]|nr:hypothetical protein [Flavobacteriaceae bacterium]|tara:strand:+ start:1349 stop:2332 length:984 start_codon:yes stop_codon:yes gene_type:complete
MLNIFYNPIYVKQKKVFLTKHLKHSVFLNYFISINYFLNRPINEKYIQSGPHKRMNNLLHTFANDPKVNFNSIKYDSSYIIQFDKYGQSILEKIIKNKNINTKVIIGPLYNIKQDEKINSLAREYPFIKKLVASEIAYKNSSEINSNYLKESTVICPSGIIDKKTVLENLSFENRNSKCLIYYKKRENHELKLVLDLLDNNNQSYDVFEYGKYNNRDLIEAAKSYKFGIIINGTETQGFAIQEIMACNLPLLVWNKTVNYFNNLELSGTSVTVWDKHCGELVYNFEQLEKKYSYFVSNLKNYNPARLILEKLTFEKFNSNLKEMFKS